MEEQQNVEDALQEAVAQLTEEAQQEELTAEDYAAYAQQAVQMIHQLHRSGDQLAMFLVHPSLKEGFLEAIQALPEEVLPQEYKEKLPIQEDSDQHGIHAVTGNQMESRFLETYFGPREQGGNGKLPRLIQYLQQQPYPVRLDLSTLRTLYVLDVMKRTGIDVDIAVASSGLPSGLQVPRR